jgi:hypothetical protein
VGERSDRATVRTDLPGGDQSVDSRSGPQIDHGLTWIEVQVIDRSVVSSTARRA